MLETRKFDVVRKTKPIRIVFPEKQISVGYQ